MPAAATAGTADIIEAQSAESRRRGDPETSNVDSNPASDEARIGTGTWFGILAMGGGMFLAVLDAQIVASSLPEIRGALSASLDETSWVQTSYLTAEVVMIPLSGMLARIFSTRLIFAASALGFAAASLACASATTLAAMIAARAVQGFAGGAMIPLVFATCYSVFPARRQPTVSIIMGMIVTLAPAVGPPLGGYITEHLSWQWLFLINVIPSVGIALATVRLIDIDSPNYDLLRVFDIPGLAAMAVFLGTFVSFLEEGPRHDWLNDPDVRILALVSSVSGVLFLWRVLRYRHPIVDLSAFLDRHFALGSLYSFTLGAGLWGVVFLVPMFLGHVRDLDSLQIGTIMLVTGCFQFLSAPIAGHLARRMDLRLMLVLGFGLLALGIYLNAFLTSESDFLELLLPQALRGLSFMICFVPINTFALGTLPPDKLKNASGLYYLMFNLGGAIGLAAINARLVHDMAVYRTRLAEHITLQRATTSGYADHFSEMVQTGAGFRADLPGLQSLFETLNAQVGVLAFNHGFAMLAIAVALPLLLLPLVKLRTVDDCA